MPRRPSPPRKLLRALRAARKVERAATRPDDDDWVITIGDVCDKGAGAAVVTALASHTLRAAAIQDPSPAHGLSLLNDALLRTDGNRFCTAAMVRLRRLDGVWQLSSCAAGHPLPLHIDASHTVTSIGTPGTLLGVVSELKLFETATRLAPGNTVVVYTDGVTEARAPDGTFYGDQRLLTNLAAATGTANDIVTTLLADVLDYQRRVARDDIAIVAYVSRSCSSPVRIAQLHAARLRACRGAGLRPSGWTCHSAARLPNPGWSVAD